MKLVVILMPAVILKIQSDFSVSASDVVDYERFENLVTHSIKEITKTNPDGATLDDIIEYLERKFSNGECIAYLAHTIREMCIHDREEKLYSNGNHWNPNTRFRYGKEY